MPKVNDIVNIIEAGIKAENLRQKANASNVANLETPGYRRADVKFEELLVKAMNSSGAVDSSEIEPQIYQPKTTAINSNGNDVNLEVEVGEMVKNSIRHKTYIRILQKIYRQIDLAISIK